MSYDSKVSNETNTKKFLSEKLISELLEKSNNADFFIQILSDVYGISTGSWTQKGSTYHCKAKDCKGLKIHKVQNVWIVKDFSGQTLASGQSGLAAFKFVESAYKLTGREIWEKIAQLLKVEISDSDSTSETVQRAYVAPVKPTRTTPYIPNAGDEVKLHHCGVTYAENLTSNYSKTCFEYIAKKLSISVKKAMSLGIYKPVLRKTVESEKGMYEITYSLENFAYALKEGENERIFNPTNPKKGFRKLPLQTVFSESRQNYVFGYAALPTHCDYIFLVEGENDCAAFNAHFNCLGWYAVTVGGVSQNVDKELITLLKERCKTVFVMYDNDKAGESGMQRIEQEHGLQAIRIARYVNHKYEYVNHNFDENGINTTLNDVCDCLKEIGTSTFQSIVYTEITLLLEKENKVISVEETPVTPVKKIDGLVWERCVERVNKAALQFLESNNIDLENCTILETAMKHGFTPVLDTDKSVTILEGNEGEYFTDTLARNNMRFEVDKRYVLTVGSGKTYTASGYAAERNKTVITVPTQNLALQYKSKYGASAYYQKNKRDENFTDFTSTPYASLHELSKKKNLQDFNLIFDESHNFTSSYYMIEQLRKAAKEVENYKSFTQLTATDLFNFDKRLDLDVIKVVAPRKAKKVQILRAKNELYMLAQLVQKAVKKGEKCVIFLNDTGNKLSKLKHFLECMEGVVTLDSDKKDTDLFQSIIKKNVLPENVNILIATSVIKEGNDIDNVHGYNTYFLGHWHASEIEQCNGRFRKATFVNCHIIKNVESKDTDYSFNLFLRAKSIIKCAYSSVAECNTAKDDIDIDTHTLERHVRNFMQVQPIRQNEEGIFEIDWLQVNMMLFSDEKSYEYRNDVYQLESLKKFGNYELFDLISDNEIICEEPTKEENKEARAAAKLTKEENKAILQSELKDIAESPTPLRYVKNNCKIKMEKHRARANEFVLKLHERAEITAKKAAEILIDEEITSDLRLNLLVARLQLMKIENNDAYMDTNRALPIFIKAVRAKFSEGGTYYSDDIRKIFIDVIKCDKSINIDRLNLSEKSSNQKMFKIISLFFNVKHGVERIDNELVRRVTLSQIDFSFGEELKTFSDKLVGKNVEKELTEILCPF